jgi:hypothetical protein
VLCCPPAVHSAETGVRRGRRSGRELLYVGRLALQYLCGQVFLEFVLAVEDGLWPGGRVVVVGQQRTLSVASPATALRGRR